MRFRDCLLLVASCLAACDDEESPIWSESCPLSDGTAPALIDIDSNARLTIALLSDGSAYCWGRDLGGACGVAATGSDWYPSPTRVEAARCLVQVSAGDAAVSLGIRQDGSAVSWGREIDFYEAGNGPEPGPGLGKSAVLAIPEKVVQVSAGGAVGLAVTESGALYHWGSSHTYAIDAPILYPAPGPVLMAEASTVIACMLVEGGEVYCFGWNNKGQLGWPADDTQTVEPVRIALPGAAKKVDVGSQRGCAFLLTDEVYCWGANEADYLGQPFEELPYSATPIRLDVPFPNRDVFIDGVGGCLLDMDRRAWCWGVRLKGYWPPEPWQPELQFEKLAVGSLNVCGLTTDRRVFCEGDNPGLGAESPVRAGFVDIESAMKQAPRLK